MTNNNDLENKTKPVGGDGKTMYWHGLVIYQVYIHSFLDEAGKGFGNLKGITSKLEYIKSLNVDMVWITPFYPSPRFDFGYDVSNYCDVSKDYGSLSDFDELVAQAKKVGLDVMIDLVLSHTSSEHPWFSESRANKTNPKADWYVWADAKEDGSPPNNWLSIFGGVAWEWDTRRCQYYLHNFLKEQPDLNFHCEEVKVELLKVVKFWLDRGVKGFRLDTTNFYLHDNSLTNNPPVPTDFTSDLAPMVNPYVFQSHLYDKSRPENIHFLRSLRGLCDEYENIVTLGEVGDDLRALDIIAEYTEGTNGLHLCYGFDFLGPKYSAEHLANILQDFQSKQKVHKGAYIAWSFSNHDVMRSVTRLGERDGNVPHATALQQQLYAILGAAGGACVMYQGEELALEEVDVPLEKMCDPYGIAMYPSYKGRDGCRTPMPWNSKEKNLGFSNNDATWLPMGVEHKNHCVDLLEKDPKSILNECRNFWKFFHSQEVLRYGSLWVGLSGDDPNCKVETIENSSNLLLIKREYAGNTMQVVFNIGIETLHVKWVQGAKFRAAYASNAIVNAKDSGLQLSSYGFAFLDEAQRT